MQKNVFIDTRSTIDSRLTAIGSIPCMSTINLNAILSEQQSESLSHSRRQPYENSKLLSTTSSPVPPVTGYDSIHGHTNSNLNNNDGTNCHQSINQQKNSALTMSQLSTVYATKRRRRNGKRWVSSFVLFLFHCFFSKFFFLIINFVLIFSKYFENQTNWIHSTISQHTYRVSCTSKINNDRMKFRSYHFITGQNIVSC